MLVFTISADQTKELNMSRNRNGQCIEQLECRVLFSGVVPADGQTYGTTTLPLVQDLKAGGTNLGQAFCSIEKGDCATDTLVLLQPPGKS
jgi:hypothetical protein